VEDFLRAECDQLNPIFFHFIQTGRPYVVAKWAMTIDGKIATCSGDACWISNDLSRNDVHEMRHRLAAIMVGINTVLADDPLLTARCEYPANQPLRVVVDGKVIEENATFPATFRSGSYQYANFARSCRQGYQADEITPETIVEGIRVIAEMKKKEKPL
jgi:hypothetical protein